MELALILFPTTKRSKNWVNRGLFLHCCHLLNAMDSKYNWLDSNRGSVVWKCSTNASNALQMLYKCFKCSKNALQTEI